MKHFLSAAVALALVGACHSGSSDTPRLDRTEGVVTDITDSAITLAQPGGKSETISLHPGWTVSVSKPISVEQIQPGSYLGTTNRARPDGTGESTEVHVSPPGASGPGLDFVMDAKDQTTMTNGIVSTVVKSLGGRVLEINYGNGSRRVTVPPGAPVVLNTPGSRDMVRPGATVQVGTFTPPHGGPVRQFVNVGENGTPPPS